MSPSLGEGAPGRAYPSLVLTHVLQAPHPHVSGVVSAIGREGINNTSVVKRAFLVGWGSRWDQFDNPAPLCQTARHLPAALSSLARSPLADPRCNPIYIPLGQHPLPSIASPPGEVHSIAIDRSQRYQTTSTITYHPPHQRIQLSHSVTDRIGTDRGLPSTGPS